MFFHNKKRHNCLQRITELRNPLSINHLQKINQKNAKFFFLGNFLYFREKEHKKATCNVNFL